MDELFFFNKALMERERDLMTNELHTSTEARKQLSDIMNGIRELVWRHQNAQLFFGYFL